MHAGVIVELHCSHACCIVLHRVACSCQQCFHGLLPIVLIEIANACCLNVSLSTVTNKDSYSTDYLIHTVLQNWILIK